MHSRCNTRSNWKDRSNNDNELKYKENEGRNNNNGDKRRDYKKRDSRYNKNSRGNKRKRNRKKMMWASSIYRLQVVLAMMQDMSSWRKTPRQLLKEERLNYLSKSEGNKKKIRILLIVRRDKSYSVVVVVVVVVVPQNKAYLGILSNLAIMTSITATTIATIGVWGLKRNNFLRQE